MAPFHEVLASQVGPTVGEMRASSPSPLSDLHVEVESLKQSLTEEHEKALDVLQAQNAMLRAKLEPWPR